MSSKSKGQKARIHESVKGVKGAWTFRGMSKHVQIPGKSPNDFHSPAISAFTLQKPTEVSPPLCLFLHDAFATYTYLHCPMRLSRLGNLFV